MEGSWKVVPAKLDAEKTQQAEDVHGDVLAAQAGLRHSKHTQTPSARQTPMMPNRYRPTQDSPPRPGGEGWLVNGEQQLLVRFSNDTPTAHSQWVILSTYRWVRPYPPVPQTRRRMLRHNAIETWQNMLKVGWRQCDPPVR